MKSLEKLMFLGGAPLMVAIALAASAGSPQPRLEGQQPSTSAAQQNAPQGQESDAQAKIRVSTNLVILPVTVMDRAGNLIADLRRDEFRIIEDNVEQHIDVFTADPFPLSIVVLVDNDLKDKDAEAVRKSLETIVGGMGPDDQAFICQFDTFFHPGKGFTSNQDQLLTELKRSKVDSQINVGPNGGPLATGPVINNHSVDSPAATDRPGLLTKGQSNKALNDAVYQAAILLHDQPRDRRRVIVLISDGVDGGKKINKMGYDDVIKTLLADNTAVYAVAVPSAYLERKVPLDPRLSPLIRYPNDSGGETYHATGSDSFANFYARLMEEARNQYTLAYIPRDTDASANFHSVEVRVKRPGLTVKTRQGYYTGIPK
jgi:VWFA-related protein